jgi:hypothetical protein
MSRDIANNVHILPAFTPVVVTDGTAQVSVTCDTAGYGSSMLAIVLGTLTDVDAVWSVLIEDSPDDSTYTAVDDAYLTGLETTAGFTFAADGKCRKIGYTGTQRYWRATIDDTTANTGNLPLAGVFILGLPSRQPTANPPQA